ncbi:MAG: hypothetical protein IJB85_04775 [Clostridia bacterium]|nr:hypothetical protein [Clostridia bacterium]
MTDTRPPVARDGSTSQSSSSGGQLIDKSLLHTAQCFINARDGIDLFTNRNDTADPKRVSRWHTVGDGEMATFRFNANHEASEDCHSLEAFSQIVSGWAEAEGFTPDDVRFSRVDFAFDVFNPDNADQFKKLCILLGAIYAVKYDVPATDQSWFTTIVSLLFKGIHVQSPRLPVSVNLYLKKIQDPKRGAIWRLELRYIRTPRNKSRLQDPESMLNAIVDELRTLPDFYEATLEKLNESLANKFVELSFDAKNSLVGNQFLSVNRERLFSREQARGFFKILSEDTNEKALIDRVDNFSDRYKVLYVSKAAFQRFVDELIMNIEIFINGEKRCIKGDVFSSFETEIDDKAS